jgi:predicted ABC-type transport system involved in lysophospholipase L1 biosynthesis ATPase subunit
VTTAPTDSSTSCVPGSQALVRCHDLTRIFGSDAGATIAVQTVSCVVHASERIAIRGPSGSGKSTLLHLMAGLDTPTSGTITWPLIGSRDQLRPGPIGVVFQAPSLIPPLSVLENVALVPALAGSGSAEARQIAQATLDTLELGDLTSRLPEELSGGQAQRVAVARALAGSPRLLLADEPTGQLDRATGALVVDVLLRVANESGAALIVTSHDPAVTDRFDQLWRMTDGAISTNGAVDP